MEYTITDFVSSLRKLMYDMFPYENDLINELKHPNRTGHIRDVAFDKNETIFVSDTLMTFDIGNEYAEKNYPYYHILEDAPVIRKRYKGTEATKGSQDKVINLGSRDYGIVSFNGKIFTKEYSKNVRGSRKSVVNNATRYIRDYNGDTIKINKGASSYVNIHYKYIEKMLTMICPRLAIDYNMKLSRVENTGLAEEYLMDNFALPSLDSDSVNSLVEMMMIV